ncbi:hypothetical protein [Schlesneria sp. DSM 10557]|uniref:hypothetical protein n=2 Tax=unclassified Schlesneria TaxID=2762017 RepID=UPI0035A080B4
MLRSKTLLTAGLMVVLTLTSQSDAQARGHQGNGGGGNRNFGGGQFQASRSPVNQMGNSNFRPQNMNISSKNVVSHNNFSQPISKQVLTKVGPVNGGFNRIPTNSSVGSNVIQGNHKIGLGNQRVPNVVSRQPAENGSGPISQVKKFDVHNGNHNPVSSVLNKNRFPGQQFGKNGFPGMNGKHQINPVKFNHQNKFVKAHTSMGSYFPGKYNPGKFNNSGNYNNKFCGTPYQKSWGYGGCWGYGGYGCNFGGWNYCYPVNNYYCGYNNYNYCYPTYSYGTCLYTPGCYGGISATILQPCVTTAYQCNYAPVYAAAPGYASVQTHEVPMEMALTNDSLPPLSDAIPNGNSDLIPPAPSATSSGSLELGLEEAKLVEAGKTLRGPRF